MQPQSMEDGGPAVIGVSVCRYALSGRFCVKPGGTAGFFILSQQLLGQDFVF